MTDEGRRAEFHARRTGSDYAEDRIYREHLNELRVTDAERIRNGTMRAITWAVRVTFANGRSAFLRHGGVTGRGPIVTFHSKAKAEAEAAFLREGLDARDVVTVIERSHGRQVSRA